MTLAFYAPLKPPDHPVPSGDRAMARGLIAALEHGGATVTLASRLRSRDGAGDAHVQRDLMAQAAEALPRLIDDGTRAGWQAWVTYHSYYKAPDLLGPDVARALGIPYIQIEATRARKRLDGPWASFARAAEDASDAADAICYLTQRDAEALRRDAPAGQRLIHLPPFLNRVTLPEPSPLTGPMLSVGMMRAGDKLTSYRIIAETLAALPTNDWHLNIAGDGPARGEVTKLMAPFKDAVTFLGELDSDALSAAYADASLFLWPGVNEAFGLSYLEAQAAGLPVVAQDRPGVCDVLAPQTYAYPAPTEGADALAQRITDLLSNPASRQNAGHTAQTYVRKHHLLDAAAERLRGLLNDLKVPL